MDAHSKEIAAEEDLLRDGPLSGVTVLDLTAVVVGPVATQFLADYGADIIKVEAPEGDILRHMGGVSRSGELSPKFLQMNRNKRSLAINLKKPEARETIRALIKRADVMAVNMRASALERLGLTYEDARKINPKIVHCSMTGFGRNGCYANKPAYDTVIQGGAGIAACHQRQSGEPRFVPMVLADHLVALIAVQMILLGLRARDLTGQGQSVEVPMFENVASFVLQEHMGQKSFEPPRGQTGDLRILDPHAKPSKTKDGYVCVSANTDRQAKALFEAIGKPELIFDPRFETVALRLKNIGEFFRVRNEALKTRTTDEWMEVFDRLDIPAFPFKTFDDLLDDPHLREVKLFTTAEYEEEGTVRHIAPANTFSGGARRTPKNAPLLGEHSAEILAELGMPAEEIAQLLDAGVVFDREHRDSTRSKRSITDPAFSHG